MDCRRCRKADRRLLAHRIRETLQTNGLDTFRRDHRDDVRSQSTA